MSRYEGYVQRFFDGVWNENNAALIDELVARDCEIHGLGESMTGTEPFRAFHSGFSTTFRDIHVAVNEELIDGDRIAYRATFKASHRATGKKVAIIGGGIIRVNAGRIVEAWNLWDFLGLLQQVNLVHADAFNQLLT